MATLTKGKTFTNGETVTPQKLHELVDLGTISGIVNADIAAGAAIADSKLAQITTAGKVLPAAVQGTAVVTADPRLSDARVPVPHGHAISDTTGLQTALDGKAASSHTHSIANVTGLQTALDGKQASGSYAPATGIAQSAVTNLTTDLAGKAASSHTHSASDINSGTLANSRTTATSWATANAIVSRDSSGAITIGKQSDANSITTNYGTYVASDPSNTLITQTIIDPGVISIYQGQNIFGDYSFIDFFATSATYGSILRGKIVQTGTSSLSYTTSSDYRLKTNIEPLTAAVARLLQIPVHRFNWLADPTAPKVDGFLAHEAQAIVPESVTGHKDEVDAEGKPIHQGIDQSKLVPLLVAAVQELAARVAALEAR